MLAFAALAAGCGMMGQMTPKTYNNTIAPKADFSPARMKLPHALSVVVAARVEEQITIKRGNGKVTIVIDNFRSSIKKAMTDAFASNFNSVAVNEAETKQGIEVVIMDVRVDKDVDVLHYHAALTHDGKDIYEMKSDIKPSTTKVVSSSPYTWMDDIANLTTEYVESNIAKLAEEIYNHLLINDEEALKKFWASTAGVKKPRRRHRD